MILREVRISASRKSVFATVYLIDKKWMVCTEVRGKKTGRPVKTFRSAKPLPAIFNSIEEQKKNEIYAKLQMMKKLRACANECSAILPQVYKDKPFLGKTPRDGRFPPTPL